MKSIKTKLSIKDQLVGSIMGILTGFIIGFCSFGIYHIYTLKSNETIVNLAMYDAYEYCSNIKAIKGHEDEGYCENVIDWLEDNGEEQ